MRVFLTGATGYIGSAVADSLRQGGHTLTGLARTNDAAARLTAAGIQPVAGDFADPSRVGSAAQNADGVISLATTYDPNVDGPAIDAILEALAGSDKPFVYTSGIWSHGDTAGQVVDETSPPRPAALVAWRQAVEERVLAGAQRGIRSVVIRPAIVYGRGAGIPAGFVDSARKEGAARFVGTGENRWPFVHVDDLADLYLLALERAPAGTLLIGVSGPSHPVRDVAAAASPGAGTGGRTVAVPLETARGAWAPTPIRWCLTSRFQEIARENCSAGNRRGPACSRTSSMARTPRVKLYLPVAKEPVTRGSPAPTSAPASESRARC
jgi:nucleoside-diphosphate-sugar epimerase